MRKEWRSSMKIKTKKKFTLPQLIEWAINNDVKDRRFLTGNGYCVGFDRYGFIYFNSSRTIPLDQTFIVEVKEEITEDSVFPKLIERWQRCDGDDDFCYTEHRDAKINKILSGNDADVMVQATHFYTENDDNELVLIWTKEKGLIEGVSSNHHYGLKDAFADKDKDKGKDDDDDDGEITEDTVLTEMITIYNDGVTGLINNKSLNDLNEFNLKSVYIMNDDFRLILIWHNGKTLI